MGACVSTHAELLKELKKNEENKLILENLKQNQEQFMALTKSLNALVESPKLLELPAAASDHVQGNEQCGCKCNCHAKLDEAGAKSLLLAALNIGDLNNLANRKLKNSNVSDETEPDYGRDTMPRRRHKNKLAPTRSEHDESMSEFDFHPNRANSFKRSMNHESSHQEYPNQSSSQPNPNHIIIVNNSSTRSSGDSMDFVNSKKYIKNSLELDKNANVECNSVNSNFILYDLNRHQASSKEFDHVTRDSQNQAANEKLKCKQCEYAIRSYDRSIKPRHANDVYDVKNSCIKKVAAPPRHQSAGIQAPDHLYRKLPSRKPRHNLVRTKSDFQKSLNFLSQKNFLNGLHSDEDSLDSSLLHALDKEEAAFFTNQKDLRKLNRFANSPASKVVVLDETKENSLQISNFFMRENMTSESVVNESEVLQFDKLSISDNTSSYSVLPIIFDQKLNKLNKSMPTALEPNGALVGKQIARASLAKLDLSCSTTSKSASSSSMSLESSLNFSLEHPTECFKEKAAETALLTRVMALSDHDDPLEATKSSKEDVKSTKSDNFDKLKLRSIVDTIGFVLFPSAGFTHKAFKLLLVEQRLFDLFQ